MKKFLAIVVAVLFVFAIASVSIAADEKKTTTAPAVEKKAETKKAETKKAETKKAGKSKQITGEVKAVDAVAKTITVVKAVKGKAEEVVVSVDDKTLADVKAGDKVEVKYTTADGKNTAKSVMKKASADKKKKNESKKEEPKKTEPAKPAAPVKK